MSPIGFCLAFGIDVAHLPPHAQYVPKMQGGAGNIRTREVLCVVLLMES
jgi:hypothetical protein